MKGSLIAAVAAGVIVGGGGAGAIATALSGCASTSPSGSQSGSRAPSQSASQSGGQDGSEKPPKCVTVSISENSGNGPVLWTKWCGTGSNGAAPMKASTGQLTVDGSALDPADCTQANPCVIVWPRSPAS
jgi:hypothetical protein